MRSPRPLFVFSLPRSGSTLVQRVLSRHPDVSTAAETWVLLPVIASLRSDVILAKYNQKTGCKALNDLKSTIEARGGSYRACVEKYALAVYELVSDDNTTRFIDKTPRYHFIAEEIMNTFEERADYVLLWRNPLSILSSMVNTFAYGRWNVLRFNFDLFKGLEELVKLQERHGDKLTVVNYEDLVSGQKSEWKSLFEGVGLEYKESYLKDFAEVRIEGMGDPTGQSKFSGISSDSVNSWKLTINSSFRINYAKKYLEWIGRRRLSLMGYDYNKIYQELIDANAPTFKNPSDLIYCLRDLIARYHEFDAAALKTSSRKNRLQVFPWT